MKSVFATKMFLTVFALVQLVLITYTSADQELMCLVCRSVIEEVESDIKKVDPRKTVKIGSYRLDPSGDQRKSEIPYANSEMHLHEVLDNLCSRMDDYAQAKSKNTGERMIIKLTTADGGMNSDISKVDLLPDSELNNKLKFYCETIVDEYEDDLISIFSKKESEPDIRLCAQITGFCPGHLDEDEYNFEKEEL